MQGTFGTGKSHAGAVIKHLLCDDISEIAGYVDDHIDDLNLKTRLLNYREKESHFSVVLSGVEGAYNSHTFALVLERAIKNALNNAGHKINVKSDFESAIELLETSDILDFEKIIDNAPELKSITKTKDEIIQKLKSADIELYLVLEEVLQKYNIQLSSKNITQWLSEIEDEIKTKNIADGLLIFWDEFTSVMDTISSDLINTIQEIAELSEKQRIYLYLISHRMPTASGETYKDITRMNDRFHLIQYKMEALTTYHIMAATLKIKDVDSEENYDFLKNNKMDKFDNLISYLTDNDSQQSKEDIKNLFPLHPYTAFLCSSLADHIGSANRSVFSFMYDSNSGFLSFLNDEKAYKENRLLTAESLWDFFLETFEADNIKYGTITKTYYTHLEDVKNKGLPYKKVFKGILLLNAMSNVFKIKQVLPSAENLRYLFSKEDFENELDAILDYLDRSQIVQRDPTDKFLITSSALPLNEINNAKKRIEPEYADALAILKYDKDQKKAIKNHFTDRLIRVAKFCFIGSIEKHYVRSRLNNEFSDETYSLQIALFFATNEQERRTMLDLSNKFSAKEFENVIFVVFNEVLDNDEQQVQKFIHYVASEHVASRLSSSEASNYKRNAELIVSNWVNRLLRQGNYTLYFNGNENVGATTSLPKYINDSIGFKIFSCNIEVMQFMRTRPMTFYKQQNSLKSAEVMLSAINRDDAEIKFSQGQYTPTKFLFKDSNDDYIVEQDLTLKAEAIDTHPLVCVQNKVDELLENAKSQHSGIFHLGNVLYSLTEAPFGLYSNIPNVALLSFALRKYKNELYSAELGVPITPSNLRDIVIDLFKYWQEGRNENKLRIRFGSREEKDLKDDLIKLFKLNDLREEIELTSIKNVRWAIASYCKEKAGYPLWSLKYSDSSTDEINIVIDLIVEMIQKEETGVDLIEKTNKAIQGQRFELKKLLQTPGVFKNGFENFINKIERVSIDDSWWDELLDSLFIRMPNEIGWWKEHDVESKVKDFYIDKVDSLNSPSQFTSTPYSDIHADATPQASEVSEIKIERAQNTVAKVRQTDLRSEQLKNILIEVLYKFPETADFINDNIG